METPQHHPIIIVGAGPAGLAIATCLKELKLPVLILEEAERVASQWSKHYDRLHLHTHKNYSHLPGLKFPKNVPVFPSRKQVLDYMENYAKIFKHEPRFKTKVLSAIRQGEIWHIKTNQGLLSTDHLIIATGRNRIPKNKSLPVLKNFTGQVIHSSEYKNGSSLKGKKVLVIGAGNTGAELALDLLEHKAKPFWCVRSPTHIVPLNSLGSPTQVSNIRMSYLPMNVTDPISQFFLKFTVGDLSQYGIERPKEGPRRHMKEKGRTPILDIGTVEAVRKGQIKVVKGLKKTKDLEIEFLDGSKEEFDAIVLATGYSPGLEKILPENKIYFDSFGLPYEGIESKEDSDHLYFVGVREQGTGVLYEINKAAHRIAKKIRKESSQASHLSETMVQTLNSNSRQNL